MEKLNLWDRIFNRHRREIVERGHETWRRSWDDNSGFSKSNEYIREFVIYKVVDRVTGSEEMEKVYLN